MNVCRSRYNPDSRDRTAPPMHGSTLAQFCILANVHFTTCAYPAALVSLVL
jgi:hypothetical protein